MSILPHGWKQARLSEVCSRIVDGSHNPPKATDTGFPMLSARNIQDRCINFDDFRFISEEDFTTEHARTNISSGDVLLTIVGTIGRTAVVKESIGPFALQRSVAVLKPQATNSKYISYALESPKLQRYFLENAKGTAQKGIYLKALAEVEILLAPLNEQKRIADKLDSLLARVDACRERLDRVPQVLKRFRQSVLAAATSGGVTEDWREKNLPSPGAPRHPLPKGEGKGLPPLPEGEGRGEGEELPEGWRWTSFVEVCESVVDCPHSTPKWTDTGKLCVRTTNFKTGVLDLSEKQYVSEITFNERIQRLRPMAGDIVYSREGGILGIACMIPTGVELCLGQRMMLFRTNPDYRSELLMHWLNSPQTLARVKVLTGGSASPHLNVRDIKTLPTPLPPLPEQHEIVRRVETLFAFADRLEARYTTARRQVDQLTPSLLAKAFRGELVPQDPNDEQAEKLLERIRNVKAETPVKLQTKRKSGQS